MYLKSPYPDPPPLPEVNAYHLFFNRPDQAEWVDYTLHIDPLTNRRRTFREFVARVDDLGTALGAPVAQGGLGLRAEDGEIVGIMSENSMDFITLIHACLRITTPFALISSYSTPFELKHALTLSKATRLFVDAKFLPLVLPVAKEAGVPLDRIYLTAGHAKGRKGVQDFVDRVRAGKVKEEVDVRPARKDTLAYLVFSSGTTGLPKGCVAVMISHGNLIYSLSQVIVIAQAAMEVYTPPALKTPEGITVALAFLPIYHTYGLHTYCFRAFLNPMTLVILPKWSVEGTLRAIPKYKVSTLALVPSMIHQLVNHPKVHHADFSSLQVLGCGAAYLPPDLAAKVTKLVPSEAMLMEGYGMSECTIAAITQPHPGALSGRMKKIPGSTGVLLPGMEARLTRDDGVTPVATGEPGELWLRSPNVAMGYWENEKANRETFVGGWLRTGDVFKVDGEGFFYFADRAKDTLKVSGSQVSPVEIENVLLSHPRGLITDATVAGVSGGRTSDEKLPYAWIVLSPAGKKLGATETIKELETWHQEKLSKYKWLRGGMEVVKEIPKSPTGKVLRRVLQERYEGRVGKKVKGKL